MVLVVCNLAAAALFADGCVASGLRRDRLERRARERCVGSSHMVSCAAVLAFLIVMVGTCNNKRRRASTIRSASDDYQYVNSNVSVDKAEYLIQQLWVTQNNS